MVIKNNLLNILNKSYFQKVIENFGLKKLVIIFIFLVGLLFRLWLVFSKAFWLDEALYFNVANNNSIEDLISMAHWMKDVPPFYLVFVKIWSFVSTSRVWLRIPGLITFVISFGILSNFFKNKSFIVGVVVLWTYSLSVYFAHIQSWLSPFNLVIMWGLVMYLLLKLFTEGFFDKNLIGFYLLSTVVHWFLISSHYSSIYFIFGYVAFLVCIKRDQPDKLKALIYAFLFALLISIPTLVRFTQYLEIYSGLYEKEMLFDIGKPEALYFNLILNSTFRYINKFYVGVALFWGLILYLISNKKDKNGLTLVLAPILLIGEYGLLYFIAPHFKSFVVERSVFIFHLGFYFFYDVVFGSKQSIKNAYYLGVLVFMIFPLISFRQYFNGSKIDYFPGDVTGMVYSQSGYDDFLRAIKSSVDVSINRKISVYENKNKVNYDYEIFMQYYLKNSPVIEGLEFEVVNDSMGFGELDSTLVVFIKDSDLVNDVGDNEKFEAHNFQVINFYDYIYY